jgi:SAM-dependent methyltransferase
MSYSDPDSQYELQKYEKVFRLSQRYKTKSGLNAYKSEDRIRRVIQQRRCETAIDFGCGNGSAAILLREAGVEFVTLLDFIPDVYLHPDVRSLISAGHVQFIRTSLWNAEPPASDFGVCTDVMEHIPEKHVDEVLAVIARSVEVCVFRIALFGGKAERDIDQLHVTVRPAEWWAEKLKKHFSVLNEPEIQRNERKNREVYCVTAYR